MKTCNVHGIGMPTSLFFRTINQTWLISCFQVNRPNENLIRLDDMDLFLEDNLHSHVFRVPRQEIILLSHYFSRRPSKCWLNGCVWKGKEFPRVWFWCHLHNLLQIVQRLISNLASPPSPQGGEVSDLCPETRCMTCLPVHLCILPGYLLHLNNRSTIHWVSGIHLLGFQYLGAGCCLSST